MIVPVVILVALLVLPAVHDAIRRPSFRRLAVRNINRRRGEASLIVLGAMLGTAIITASLVTTDTIDASIRDIARTDLGPIDEVIVFEDPADADTALRLLQAGELDGIDGVMTTVESRVAVASVVDGSTGRRAEPRVDLAELDVVAAQRFGHDESITGFADVASGLAPGEAVIVDDLADELQVSSGDPIDIFAYGQELRLTIREVAEGQGAAGFSDIYVAPGTVVGLFETALADPAGPIVAEPPNAIVLVSNEGGIFDGAEGSDAVVAAIEDLLGQHDDLSVGEIVPVKSDLLDEAERDGAEIGGVFFAIGSFSVIAGILLLVNLFVMLAEERKGELGMLRAIGMKRNHLLRSFGLEGAIYSIISSALGALLGILVGWVIVRLTFSVFNVADDGLKFVLSIEPASILLGMMIGVVISTVTVWATSIRISRLNMISAIRDLPDPPAEKHRRALVFGLAGVAAGAVATLVGVSGPQPMALVAGPALVAVSASSLAAPLAGRYLPAGAGRVTTQVLAVVALIWGISVFSIFSDEMESSGIGVFVVQGVVLVAAAVLIASTLDRYWAWLANTLARSGRGLSTRLGLAYPMARKVRTGLLLGMYSLVIFMMVFLSSFTAVFGAQAPGFVDDMAAGNDLVVDTNRANPADAAQLAALPEVSSALPLIRAFPEFLAASIDEPERWAVAGYDESLLAGDVPRLASRLDRFDTDRDVFVAALADPTLAIPNDFFLADGPPGAERLDIGDSFTMIDPADGSERELTIAGFLASDFIFNGMFLSADTVRGLGGDDAVASRHYVTVADGVDAGEFAPELTAALLPNGARVQTFDDAVAEELAETEGFIALLRGFLGLGLVIGIAGLGVVMVRAVRERRRQIGMLRALGVQSVTVGRAFLLEALVIAVQGIVIGVGLGLATSWSVIAFSTVFGEQQLPFVMPWAALVGIVIIPLVASVLAVLSPATRASVIRPAAALRIAD